MRLPSMIRLGRLKLFPARMWFTEHVHGPKHWPWWRLVSIAARQVDGSGIRFNRNVWFYTRWGAWVVQVAWDNRKFVA